jgi:hypothetical protein
MRISAPRVAKRWDRGKFESISKSVSDFCSRQLIESETAFQNEETLKTNPERFLCYYPIHGSDLPPLSPRLSLL